MTTIDYILAIPLLWGLIIGFKKGLILELASLAALVLGVFGAIYFSDYAAQYLVRLIELSPKSLSILSFFFTFILIVLGVFFMGKILDKALKIIYLGLVNRILGAIFGLLKYALIVSFVLYFFDFLNQKLEFMPTDYREKSLLYDPLMILKAPFSTFLQEFEIDQLEEKTKEIKKLL